MQTRNIAIAAFLAASSFTSFAGTFVGGEQGYIDSFQGSASRELVLRELAEHRANPVGADGTRFVGGEQGVVLPAPRAAGAAPAPVRTRAEQAKFAAEYPA